MSQTRSVGRRRRASRGLLCRCSCRLHGDPAPASEIAWRHGNRTTARQQTQNPTHAVRRFGEKDVGGAVSLTWRQELHGHPRAERRRRGRLTGGHFSCAASASGAPACPSGARECAANAGAASALFEVGQRLRWIGDFSRFLILRGNRGTFFVSTTQHCHSDCVLSLLPSQPSTVLITACSPCGWRPSPACPGG